MQKRRGTCRTSLCHGNEVRLIGIRNLAECSLAAGILAQLRQRRVDLDSLALQAAIKAGSEATDKRSAMAIWVSSAVQHLLAFLPTAAADPNSAKQIRELEEKLAETQAALQAAQGAMVPKQAANQAAAPSSKSDTGIRRFVNIGDPPGVKPANLPESATAESLPMGVVPPVEAPEIDKQAQTAGERTFTEPADLLQLPKQASPWLNQHCPDEVTDAKITKWVNGLKLPKQRKAEVKAWAEKAAKWAAGLDAPQRGQLERAAVVWGMPVKRLSKISASSLGRVLAIAVAFLE